MSDSETEKPAFTFKSSLREGFTDRVIELIFRGYDKMCKERHLDIDWDEETFSTVLVGCIDICCQNFASLTHQVWHVEREHFKDSEQLRRGEGNPRAVPRIDIVIFNWARIGTQKRRFPFECKLLDAEDSELIRLYIQKGLIDRYLNQEKDYADGLSWGGMIGYIRQGHHSIVVSKLNKQIDRQLNTTESHLTLYKLITDADAIYKSQHQYPKQTDILTIMHLLLTFHIHLARNAKE